MSDVRSPDARDLRTKKVFSHRSVDIELVVRPQAHIHLGMKAEQVIESIKEAADATISTLSNVLYSPPLWMA